MLQLSKGRYRAVTGPVLTVVLDGVGLAPPGPDNAVHLARTPTLDHLFSTYGVLPLAAHGAAVGLPSEKDMGNSEVGHNALGAGRIFKQGTSLVQDALSSGALFEGDCWRWLLDGARQRGGALHFIGLLSDGNVHSHEAHLHAMLRRASADGIKRCRVHALLDGRDVPPRSALQYAARLEAVLTQISAHPDRDYRVASGGGRMTTTMDRYGADWSMVERGWATHVRGEGRRLPSLSAAIETLRDETGLDDQNLPAFVIADADGAVGPIRDGDSVVLFNFRGDRAIEISQAFEAERLTEFDRGPRPDVRFAGLMQYDGDLDLPRRFLVTPPAIDRSMGEYLSDSGVPAFACSETQKYGHVTYFWNGNRSGAFDPKLETYVEVPSDVVPFEQRPWMKAAEIVDQTLAALSTGGHRVGRINLANGDMVGHTGVLRSAILAVETVDLALGRLLDGIKRLGGVALITADHGNCEQMAQRAKDGTLLLDASGAPVPMTSHTLNAVPLCLFDPGHLTPGLKLKAPSAGLSNVAATTFELLGLSPPEGYDSSLLR